MPLRCQKPCATLLTMALTARQEERRVFASFPGWKVQRARLAALARHHPDDRELLDSEANLLALIRAVELIRWSFKHGLISGIDYVEIVGPVLCPQAIAKD